MRVKIIISVPREVKKLQDKIDFLFGRVGKCFLFFLNIGLFRKRTQYLKNKKKELQQCLNPSRKKKGI